MLELAVMLLLPTLVPAGISLAWASRAPYAGYRRLFLLAASAAFWFAPLLVGASHGVLPLPVGSLVTAFLFRPDSVDACCDVLSSIATVFGFLVFAIGWVLAALVFAAILRILVPAWSLRTGRHALTVRDV